MFQKEKEPFTQISQSKSCLWYWRRSIYKWWKKTVLLHLKTLENEQKENSPFFICGRYENIDVCFSSIQKFELLLVISYSSKINILFTQIAKAVQSLFNAIADLIHVLRKVNSFARRHGKISTVILRKLDWMVKKLLSL